MSEVVPDASPRFRHYVVKPAGMRNSDQPTFKHFCDASQEAFRRRETLAHSLKAVEIVALYQGGGKRVARIVPIEGGQ